MIRIFVAVFIVLHGLVHILYFGQSARFFELKPGMDWPNGARVFSIFLGAETTRTLANFLLVVAAFMFIGSSAGILLKQVWWSLAVIAAAVFSTAVYFLLWDGKFERLADNGWVGILINLVILAAILLFNSPEI